MPYTDSGHIAPLASKVKIIKADGSVVYQQPLGKRKYSIPSSLKNQVFTRDGNRCRYCGFKHKSQARFTLDQPIPTCKGGMEELDNLVVCCRRCKQAKRNQVWEPVVKPRWKLYKLDKSR